MMDTLVFDVSLPPAQFRGRAPIVEGVSERLRRPQLQSSTIVGGPKMGKTSILRFLCSDAADAHFAGTSVRRVYFDAQVVGPGSSGRDFWIGVLRSIVDQAPDGPEDPPTEQARAKAAAPTPLSKFDVIDVFDGFAKAATPIALFVDNFDTLLRNDHFWTGSDFFHSLRHLDEREPRGLAFVVATCRHMRDYWRPAAVSPFFNTWLNFTLELFSEAFIDDWASGWLAGVAKGEAKTIRSIMTEASCGHPFIANFALGECLDQHRRGQKPDRAAIARKLGDPDGPGVMLVQRITAEMVPFEREMLRALESGRPPVAAHMRALRALLACGLLPPATPLPAEAAP